MAGLISVSGLVSGLDVDGIIQQIMDFESRPIESLQSRIDREERTLGAIDIFEARLLALQTNFARLTTANAFAVKTVNTTDEDVLTASASSAVAPGVFSFTVDQLAQSHQIAAQGYASAQAVVGSGEVVIRVGNEAALTINLDDSNNTLAGLAQAINDAEGDVSASVVNTRNGSAPYSLLITSKKTGESNIITVDSNLTGGIGLNFGAVSTANNTGVTGTSAATASGSYTGNAEGTLTFTVDSGGTVGTDTITVSYTDGADVNGTFTIPSNYVPGEDFTGPAGLNLSFAAGTLNNGDEFTVDVTSGTVQRAEDAIVRLGDGGGLAVYSETNTLTTLVEGLTINLHRASTDPVTVSIEADTEKIAGDIEAFVDQYNGFVELMDELFYVEPDDPETGILLGDYAARDIYNNVQRTLTGAVEGLASELRSLDQIGIGVGFDGKLTLTSSKLNEALSGNLEQVQKLFSMSGQTDSDSIRFLNATEDTKAYSFGTKYQDGYELLVTRAAERARLVGGPMFDPASTPIVIDDSNHAMRFKIRGGAETEEIYLTHGTYSSGAELAAEIQKQLDGADETFAGEFLVEFEDFGGGVGRMNFSSSDYGSGAFIEIAATSEGNAYSSLGLAVGQSAQGVDVAGQYYMGDDAQGNPIYEGAVGDGQFLTGSSGNEYTDGLRVLVTATTSQIQPGGTSFGNVKVTRGIAAKMQRVLKQATSLDGGDVFLRKEAINGDIETLTEQMDRLTDRLEIRRERIVQEFLNLETVLAQLQSEGDYLSQALAALPTR